jgi:hypothetical protein
MRIALASLLLLATPALAQSEDAAHRADRQETAALNRSVTEGAARRDRANAAAIDRYRSAIADYNRRRAEWQRRVAACQAGDAAACQ